MAVTPLFITMFTPLYAGEVRQLQESFSEFNLELSAVEIACRGSWILNVQQKARVIHAALDQHPNRPIVWLDADARMRAYPELLMSMDDGVDFAAFMIPGVFKIARKRPWGPERGPEALAGGTMYFGNTAATRRLVERWLVCCVERPTTWEQQNLQRALGQMLDAGGPIRWERLPQAYLKVFDRNWYPGEKGSVVIEHMQASRRLKRKVT